MLKLLSALRFVPPGNHPGQVGEESPTVLPGDTLPYEGPERSAIFRQRAKKSKDESISGRLLPIKNHFDKERCYI